MNFSVVPWPNPVAEHVAMESSSSALGVERKDMIEV